MYIVNKINKMNDYKFVLFFFEMLWLFMIFVDELNLLCMVEWLNSIRQIVRCYIVILEEMCGELLFYLDDCCY